MSLRETLETLLEVRGIRGLAVVTEDGSLVEAVGRAAGDVESVTGLVAGALVATSAIAELFGDGEVRQATLEFAEGPVLLEPLASGAGPRVLVVRLAAMDDLGRARAAVRRARDAVAEAATP